MKVGELIELLEGYEEEELAIDVAFPQIDWSVRDYSYAIGLNDEEEPTLTVEVWEGDFDFPDVLKRLKKQVAAIPDWATR